MLPDWVSSVYRPRIAMHLLKILVLALVGWLANGATTDVSAQTASESMPRKSRGCGLTPPTAPGQSRSLSLPLDGLTRTYRLHLPTDYDENAPTPIVLNFHGYTGTAEGQERYTQMSQHADANGYVVVYPQSTAFQDSTKTITSWNDLTCNASPGPEGPICAADATRYPNAPECPPSTDGCNWCSCHDDLGFVEALLDTLESRLCLDLDRVYATGMSNGGMFVHRLGCSYLADRFAALAPVAGTLAKGFNCAPEPTTRLSIMNLHGVRDTVVPMDGSKSSDGFFYLPVTDVIDRWAGVTSQQCEATFVSYPTPVDGTLAFRCMQRDHCATGAQVVACTWNGAHTWPGGPEPFGTHVIWTFFMQNPK